MPFSGHPFRAPVMKITHGPSPAPTKPCSESGGQCTEVPRLERPLLALDQQQAIAREDEEVLLVGLTVIPPARLSRLEHGQDEADVGEGCVVALEDAGGSESLVRHPRPVPDVDDEPAVAHGREAGVQLFKARFLDHFCSSPCVAQPPSSPGYARP
jgi:hypothetical protein